jgi:hypothetical protein
MAESLLGTHEKSFLEREEYKHRGSGPTNWSSGRLRGVSVGEEIRLNSVCSHYHVTALVPLYAFAYP